MDRDQIVLTLRRHASDLQALGAASLFLFGSVARNEATSASDVDLFFEFDDPSFSLIELVVLQDRISDLVRARADVMSRGSIHPKLRSAIEGSALQVF
ncbi:MAG: nucleotidyltransferase family protein [Caulobacteraceae bacterium]